MVRAGKGSPEGHASLEHRLSLQLPFTLRAVALNSANPISLGDIRSHAARGSQTTPRPLLMRSIRGSRDGQRLRLVVLGRPRNSDHSDSAVHQLYLAVSSLALCALFGARVGLKAQR